MFNCTPDAAERQDVGLIAEIREARGIANLFETPGKRWTDAHRAVFHALAAAAPDLPNKPGTGRRRFLARHARVSGET